MVSIAESASSILTILLNTNTSVEFSGAGHIFKTGVFNLSKKNCVGLALVVLFGMLKYNQVPNIYGFIGICLIVIGVIMVNYLGRTG